MKDLCIILRLGSNSLRESEYSCLPPVCHSRSFTRSLNAEPRTIGEELMALQECWLFPALKIRLSRAALIETMLSQPKGSSWCVGWKFQSC